MNNPSILIREQYDTLGIEPELYEEGLEHFTKAHTIVAEQGVIIEELTDNPFTEIATRLHVARESDPEMEELSREPAFVLGVVSAVTLRREAKSDEVMLEAALEHSQGGSI